MSINTEADELTPIFEVEIKSPPRLNKGSSWLASSFMVVNAALGAGLLNFPQAYHQAGGVVVAVAIQSVFLVFVIVALVTLSYASDRKGSSTYQDTVYFVCGRKARNACAVSILLYCFGTCITFLIIIGDQWEEFFLFVSKSTYCHDTPVYMNRWFTIIVTSSLFIMPMIYPQRIDYLKYASVVGVIGILYVVGLVTVKYFMPHPEPGSVKTHPDSWIDVFLVVPDICFAYQCHVSVIPIYSCMEKRNLKEFSKTLTLAMTLCVLTYTVTAALGYLMFGDNITSDILLSFEPDIPVLIAVVLIAVKTYTTYPILLFCGRAAFDCLWIAAWGLTDEQIVLREKARRITVSSVWFAITLILAIFIPNIGVVIQILGAFAAIFIFIFPGMCLLKLMLDRPEQTRQVKLVLYSAVVFIVLGTFIFGLTLSQALIADVKNHGVKADKSSATC